MASNGKTIKVTFGGEVKPLENAVRKGEAAVGRFGKSFDKVKTGVGAAAAGVGLAAGAAIMSGVTAGLEQSKVQAKLAAQLGASGGFAQDIGKITGGLYGRGVVASMDEAADAVKAVWQNKLVLEDATNEQIEAVAAKVSTLGTIMEADAGRVSNAVKQMVRTGIAESSEQAFDILARGAQVGADKAGDLLDTFNEYGTQFRKLGLEGPQSLGLISQAIKAGARDSDVAADALKEFSIRAVDGSKLTAQGFKAIGLDAGEMAKKIGAGGASANQALDLTLDRLRAIPDPVKRSQAAVALFGTQAEDLGDALFAMDPSTAVKGLGNLAGAAGRAGDTLEQSAGAKLEAFKRQAQTALVDQLAKAIPYIEATFGWLQRNSGWVTPLATGLGILAAAIGVVVAVQWAWNAALALWPGTWIIAGIALLVAAIVLVATKTQFFQTVWGAVWGFLKGVGAWFAGPFAGFFLSAWDKIWGFLKAVGAWFSGPFAGFFTAVGSKITSFAKGAWSVVSAYFGYWAGLFSRLREWASSAISFITSKFSSFVGFLGGLPGRARGALSSMWDGLKSGFRSAINWVIDRWNALQFRIPSFSVFGKTIGGGTVGVPNIGRLATGGHMTPGRTYLTGENGPELITAGRDGGYVHPAGDTAAMGAPEVHVYLGDRELTDIIRVEMVSHDRRIKRRAGARLAGAPA